MKKRNLLILLIIGLFVSVFAAPKDVEAASNKTMKKAYTKYLKNTVSGKKYYAIVNIGKGNKPALLVAKGASTYSNDPENGSKNYYYACDVYYYVKGKVKKIGTFAEGARPITLEKKSGQYYLRNGLSDAAFFAYIKSNKLYLYEFYEEYGTSKLTAGGKTIKKYGCLTSSQYHKKKNAYKHVKTVKFVKNSYGYIDPNLAYKEDSHTYKNYTYFTGYLVDDAYPNVYKQSKKTKRITQIQYDAHIIGAKGKYLLTEGNQGDYGPVRIYVINAKTGKVKSISKNAWGVGTAAKISGSYAYYPEFAKYEYNSYTFKMKRYKLSNGKKKTLTKKISCNEVIKYTSKYVQYKKGSAEYIYYYSSGKIKKVTPQSTANTTTTTSNNTTSNTTTTTVQPSVKISTGSTGANTCTLTATTVPSGAAVTWKSSNSSVASVSGGKVTAKAAGTAKITASITYGGKTYTASKTVTVAAKKSYGSWSSWSTNAVSATSTREVRTTALYRYYYFYCPVCGGREPLQGLSDCHQYSLSQADAHAGWFTTPYSQSNSAAYSYASYKRYTTSLGDGKMWNFSTGNINHTAIGTKDTDSDAVVITTGYSYRSVATSYYVSAVN